MCLPLVHTLVVWHNVIAMNNETTNNGQTLGQGSDRTRRGYAALETVPGTTNVGSVGALRVQLVRFV